MMLLLKHTRDAPTELSATHLRTSSATKMPVTITLDTWMD